MSRFAATPLDDAGYFFCPRFPSQAAEAPSPRTRITVKRVLLALATYTNREDLQRANPELEDEDIRQALGYAAANLEDQIDS